VSRTHQLPTRQRLVVAGAALAATAVLGACGSSGSYGSKPAAGVTTTAAAAGGAYGADPTTVAPATTTTATAAAGSGATVALGGTAKVPVLVDAQGFTLYLFTKDTGTTSNCSGGCATAWPPTLSTGAPVAGNGLDATLLGTTKRADGATQVTYNGHPLYRFAADKAPGDSKGQGSGGFWYMVSAAGDKVEG
jgi:predicted lipoprotein with Yx(FWY)xxD motif